MRPISRNMADPSFRLSLIWAVVLMSSKARCTVASAALHVAAAHHIGGVFLVGHPAGGRAAGPTGAEREHAATLRVGRGDASAWMLVSKSACTRRALSTRVCSGTKKSASRVM